MVEIPQSLFLVLLQGSLLFLFVLLFWAVKRLRARKSGTAAPAEAAARDKPADPTHYFTLEEKSARGRYEELGYKEDDAMTDRDREEQLFLALRADLMAMEGRYATEDEHDEAFWKKLYEDMRNVLKQHDLYNVLKRKGEDEFGFRELMQNQNSTIDSLQAFAAEHIADEGARQNLQNLFDGLQQQSRELAGCISVLEDENEFLRAQVESLVR